MRKLIAVCLLALALGACGGSEIESKTESMGGTTMTTSRIRGLFTDETCYTVSSMSGIRTTCATTPAHKRN